MFREQTTTNTRSQQGDHPYDRREVGKLGCDLHDRAIVTGQMDYVV